jgi:hypothetical protein
MRSGVDSYACSYSSSGPTQCNSARSLQDQTSTLLFGFYSQGTVLEALNIRDGNVELCRFELSGVQCAPARGLGKLTEKGISSAAYDKRLNRSILYGVFPNSVAVCKYQINSKEFICAEESTTVDLVATKPIILTTRNKSGKPLREYLSLQTSSKKWGSSTSSTETKDFEKIANAFVSALENVGVAKFGQRVDSNSTAPIKSKVLGPDDDEDSELYVPQNLQAELDNGWSYSLWSDSFGSFAWQWWLEFAVKSLKECLDDCKSEHEFDVARCSVYEEDAALVGIWVTAVATLTVVITPGIGVSAPVVIAGGLGATASLSSLVGSSCRSGAFSRWAGCQSWARSNCF